MAASIIPPGQIPNATPEQLSPILLRLLECPKELLPDLAWQSAAAIADLPEDARPESYEGLLDVARFCVEDEPGWEVERRAKFIGGHPRIGAPLNAPASELSEESRKEQMKGGQVDPATLEKLARLNAIYEAKFPGLRFVTYVAGRSRAAVADEIASLLGDKTAALKDAIELSEADIRAQGTDEWQSELDRASDALWEIAVDRAGKLKLESESNNGSTAAKASNEDGEESKSEAVPSTASATEVPASTDSTAAVTKDGKASSDSIGQDVPFLSLPSFRMLVLSSPVLESFFKSDLTESFYLDPVERSQSGGAYAWHTAPSLPGAPRAVPGASKEPASEATYSRDVTTGARGKVVGFLGNLLGEEGKAKMNQLADQVGQRLQTHTVTGPRPSFGRNSTLDGGKMDTQELREKEAEERRRAAEERKSTLGNRLFNALRAPARTPSTQDLKSAAGSSSSTPLSPSDSQAERGRTLEKQPSFSSGTSKADKRISLRGSDLSTAGPKAAAEALRAAQEALLQERPAFVIDEVGEDEGEGEADDGAEGGAEVEDLGEVVEEAHSGQKAEGLLSGREAQMAKDLRSAPAQ